MSEKIICEERTDEGIRFFKDGCCGTIRTIEAGGDKRVIEPILVMDYRYDEGCRVRKDGISPTLNATKTGSTSPSGQTLLVESMIVASRGRNPHNPSDRTPGNHVEQRLEPNSDGICNTLTSVKKDNLVLEPKKVGQISNEGSQCGTVYSQEGLSPTLTAGAHGYAIGHIEHNYRIRKLTPLECWRLMGFTDEDFYKAKFIFENEQSLEELTRDKFYSILYSNLSEAKKLYHIKNLEIKTRERMSNTQLYKQAGNSIVVNVLEGIFRKML